MALSLPLCLGEAGIEGIVYWPFLGFFTRSKAVVVWDHGKGFFVLTALAGVLIIFGPLWLQGWGTLVMVGQYLWVSLLVRTGGGGFHVFSILTDYIPLVPVSWKMPFPVFNTKTVLLISGSKEKVSFLLSFS